MQILYTDPYYDAEAYERNKYSGELLALMQECGIEAEAHDADIGRGADWPVVLLELYKDLDWSSLLTLAGASGVLLGGKKLNESLEGWLEVGRKVKALFARHKPTRIDEQAATVLALLEASEQSGESPHSVSLRVEEIDPLPIKRHKLSKKPDALYIFSIRAGHFLYISGYSSLGDRVFEHRFDTRWYEFDPSPQKSD